MAITREEAIVQLSRYDSEHYTPQNRQAHRMAIAALKDQEERRWIPVTDRLPELIPCNAGSAYSEAVIVWTSGRKVMIAVWDGVDFLCAADYWDAEGEEITHWMPVPVMTKEDNNEL